MKGLRLTHRIPEAIRESGLESERERWQLASDHGLAVITPQNRSDEDTLVPDDLWALVIWLPLLPQKQAVPARSWSEQIMNTYWWTTIMLSFLLGALG